MKKILLILAMALTIMSCSKESTVDFDPNKYDVAPTTVATPAPVATPAAPVVVADFFGNHNGIWAANVELEGYEPFFAALYVNGSGLNATVRQFIFDEDVNCGGEIFNTLGTHVILEHTDDLYTIAYYNVDGALLDLPGRIDVILTYETHDADTVVVAELYFAANTAILEYEIIGHYNNIDHLATLADLVSIPECYSGKSNGYGIKGINFK